MGNTFCTANCLRLCIYSVSYTGSLFFKIKMIGHRAKSFSIWPGMTPPSAVFTKIYANKSISGWYDKNNIHLTFNCIILSRTI